MKRLLITSLVLASVLSAQAVRADETSTVAVSQPQAPAVQTQAATQPAPQPIVIAWDRVGDKLKGWV